MKLPYSITQRLTRPSTLWLSFACVVLLTTLGLAALSLHVLRLSRQQSESTRREDIQQNIRVALWRLDSRLAPYVATIHDLSGGPRPEGAKGVFVLQRFRVQGFQESGTKGTQFSYGPVTTPADQVVPRSSATDSDQQWQQLEKSIPVQQLMSVVNELHPEDAFEPIVRDQPGQSLVQNYRGFPEAADELSGRELDNRSIVVQRQVAANSPEQQLRQASRDTAFPDLGPTQLIPVWVDGQLVIVRIGPRGFVRTLDGVWVDWQALQESLLADVADLLPAATLNSVLPDETFDPSRTLAALPVMIVPAPIQRLNSAWSATHTALSLAWLALLTASLIAAVALSRMISLSERRASFVSAVTHELRTPLTTFRLYSDLLAREMVADPADRQEYLQTLRREADRLTHLVDNVLRYSRLERTSKCPELESVQLSQWVDRITPRLRDRLSSAAMELIVSQSGNGQWKTDPAAMEQVVFNLIDNAAKYAARADDRRVHLNVEMTESMVRITVLDHGPGVPNHLQSNVFKPFSKSAERAAETASGVGLGLALARQTTSALGGRLKYQQARDGGASFTLTVPRQDN